MLYTIENEKIRVVIDSVGAEFHNLILKEDGTEYLWQGDPEYWKGRAFNLFPICGRLVGGKYTYKGKDYRMEIHGFLRTSDTEVTEQTADRITFRLTDSGETRAQYPFGFEVLVTYVLSGNTVKTVYTVRNTGDTVLPFALGGHPGFNIPLLPGERFEDYYLEFGEAAPAKMMVFSDACMYTDEVRDFPLEGGKVLPLRHSLFDNDAIFLRDMSRKVTLKNTKNPKTVEVCFDEFPYLGLWHAPRKPAPYLCIEPWSGVPSYEGVVDDMDTKKDMFRLAPGGVYETSFTVTIR